MKFLALLSLVAAAVASPLNSTLVGRQSQPQGIDVSGFQPNVNWNTVKANGISFAFIKATEGTSECFLASIGKRSKCNVPPLG